MTACQRSVEHHRDCLLTLAGAQTVTVCGAPPPLSVDSVDHHRVTILSIFPHRTLVRAPLHTIAHRMSCLLTFDRTPHALHACLRVDASCCTHDGLSTLHYGKRN